ncbi:hypothetical protein L596_008098 [Steinernema carpocapsae]|uniref:SLC26A/SulP transporter domain-containing protein n=1 Tax=Steinernema carpocapsae TaxID=34508 RepID=A0A4U5PBI4_STECR|nr:hypothetical protein L596_008098 [Steinernema carpocapsae]
MTWKENFVTLYNESTEERGPRKMALKCLDPFTSCKRFSDSLLGFFPIVSWLPQYRVKQNLFYDISSGVTVGIFMIPQGIAFSALARIPPVYGLYTAFFPIFFFQFFGTSPFLSVGPSALLALMSGVAKERLLEDPAYAHLSDIQVVRTITFAYALVEILTGVLRLDFLIAFVSDQLVDGYVVASSAHVLTSQLGHVLGYSVLSHNAFGDSSSASTVLSSASSTQTLRPS